MMRIISLLLGILWNIAYYFWLLLAFLYVCVFYVALVAIPIMAVMAAAMLVHGGFMDVWSKVYWYVIADVAIVLFHYLAIFTRRDNKK